MDDRRVDSVLRRVDARHREAVNVLKSVVSSCMGLIALVVAVVAIGGCGTSTTVCVRNSECSSGRYCSGGTCAQDCTAATVATTCGPGQTCSSFGQCLSAPDGGVGDAHVERPDAGFDAFDSRPACVIAGGTDADGDGYCAAGAMADCDDTTATTHPGAVEVCSPQAGPTRGADEDCDAHIDEACDWHFAQPHPLVRQHVSGYAHFTPQVSRDGLRLYFVHYDGTAAVSALYMATRTSLSTEFGVPARVAMDLSGSLVVAGATLSSDELEVFLQVGAPAHPGNQFVYRATRPSITMPFTHPTRVEAAAGTFTASYHPHLSRDGTELLFLADAPSRTVERLVRTDVAMSFTGTAETVMLPPDPATVLFPTLSADGLTVFYSSSGQLYRAARASRTLATFTMPTDIADLNVAGAFAISLYVSEPTGEIFFDGANRPDSPTLGGVDSMFRARLCRDAACSPIRVDCDVASGQVRNANELHCYWQVATPAAWGSGLSACGTGHMATVHSTAEQMLLSSTGGWIGGYDGNPGVTTLPTIPDCANPTCSWAWVTGEPWIFSNWAAGEPNNAGTGENGLAGGRSPWNDYMTDAPLPVDCERELWPTW